MAEEKIISIKVQTEAQTKSIADLQTRLVELTKRRNALNKKIRDGAKLTQAEKNELGKLQPELVATRNRLRDLEREVVKANKALKKNSGFVAGVKKGMLQAGKSIALYAGGFLALGRVIGNVAQVIANFDKSQGNLRAVTGKTKEELKALTDQAKELGSTTAFTATQTTEAQTELAKLGFTIKEITQLTPSVLSLASATGVDLADASAVAGSTIRAFGLSAKETQRVVDVMANSFTKSSLDFRKFETAMANVAPVANSAGVSIEETTALIGTLTDAGIDASTAGTGLRNVFLELAKSGMSFEEAMKEIQTSTNKNATALDLFGKRGATIGTVLASNTQKTKELTEALNNSAGSAEKMAKEQLNTLTGRVTLLTSAWEGLILKIDSGESVFSSAFNGVTEWTTGFLVSLTNLGEEWDVMFNGLDGASEKSVQAIIKMSRSMDVPFNKMVRLNDFLEEFNEQTLEELEGNIDAQRIAFIKSAEAQNKSTKEAVGLWNAYINLRREEEALTEETEDNTEKTALNNKVKEELLETTKELSKEEAKRIDKEIRKRRAKEAEALLLEQLRLENTKKLKTEYAEKTNKEIELVDMDYEEDADAREDARILESIKKEDARILESIKKNEEAEKKKLDDKNFYIQAGLKSAELAGTTLSAINSRVANQQIRELERQKEEGLITEENYKNKVEEIRRKEFNNQKKISLALIAIKLAEQIASIQATASANPTNAVTFGASGLTQASILTALAVATSTAQAGLVASQKYNPTKFADGGLLNGASHEAGGIPFTINGQSGYEAEGGEAIINKRSTSMFLPLLSAINEAGGGVAFSNVASPKKFAKGGLTPSINKDKSMTELFSAMNERINNIKVVNVASETASVANRVNNIESNASFG